LIFLITRFGEPLDDAGEAGLFVVTTATGLFGVGVDFSFRQKFDFVASFAVNL
jgi:hypothetical protein